MTVTLPLQPSLNPHPTVVVMTAEPGGKWIPIPVAKVSRDFSSVTFTTNHLSLFEAIQLDINVMVQTFEDDFTNGLTAGMFAKPAKPQCPSQAAARSDGYTVSSSSGDTLFWCLGLLGSQRTLVVVNNRSYVLAIQHPSLSLLSEGEATGLWGDVSRLVAKTYNEALVFPSESNSFGVNLAVGKQGGVATHADPASQLLYSLETGVSALIAILSHFDFDANGTGSSLLDKTGELLNKAECFEALKSALNHKQADIGGVMSACLKPAEVLEAFGIWGIILAPIMAVAGVVDYFNSSVQGLVDVVFSRDQYQIVISHHLASACPTSSTVVCIRSVSGDVNGDGQVDQVGVTYDKTKCDTSTGGLLGCMVVVHVVLSTGMSFNTNFTVSSIEDVTNVSFLGLTNLLNNGHQQIVLASDGCSSGCGKVYVYELTNSGLRLVAFNGGAGLYDANGGISSGFTCDTQKHQIVTFLSETGFDQDGPAVVDVYQPDGSNMTLVGHSTQSYLASQTQALDGAHCPGLSRY